MIGDLLKRVVSLFHRSRIESEMDEELRAHIRSRADDLERSGLPRAEAERRARIEFGGVERFKEECREALGTRLVDTVVQDMRFGLRMLRKSPGFTVVAIITLALGIGANTAIFSAVYGILLKPLDYPRSSQLVAITGAFTPQSMTGVMLSFPEFEDIRTRDQDFQQVAAWDGRPLRLTGSGAPEQLLATRVTGDYFSTLGMKPIIGRPILHSDCSAGSDRVVVISYGLWRSHFGASSAILGKAITLGGQPYAVIGVVPPEFDSYVAQSKQGRVWTPLVPPEKERISRGWRDHGIIARLKKGVTLSRANKHLRALSALLAEEYPKTDKGWVMSAERLQDSIVKRARAALLVLLAAVGLVLLIACANVSNLALARAWGRRKEAAIREAVGATHLRLFRQFLVECILLGLAGGALGLALAFGGVSVLRAIAPPYTPRVDQIRLDVTIFGYAFGISLFSAMLFGIVPSLRISRGQRLDEALKEGWSAERPAIEGRSAGRLRGALVVAEVALAFLLLIASALTIRSFRKLTSVPLGFRTNRLLTMSVGLSRSVCQHTAPCRAAFDQIARRVAALPGVEGVALSSMTPMSGYATYSFSIEGQPKPKFDWQGPSAEYLNVSPGYFRTMGIEILRGRAFTSQDTAGAAPVAIVSHALARRYFSGNALGKHVRVESQPAWATIVGETNDARDIDPSSRPKPELYLPFDQAHPFKVFPSATLLVRAAAKPVATFPAIRQQVWTVDKKAPVGNLETGDEIVSEAVANPRFRALLLSLFGGLGLLLALSGIYGVLQYATNQRRHEIGVRTALGASPGNILLLMLRQGLLLTLAGMAIGLCGALALTRFLRSLLFGVTPTDPATFAGAAVLLAVVALVACYLPAQRAARVDPMAALRHE